MRTVWRLTTSSSAISGAVSPSAASWRISTWRGVSGARFGARTPRRAVCAIPSRPVTSPPSPPHGHRVDLVPVAVADEREAATLAGQAGVVVARGEVAHVRGHLGDVRHRSPDEQVVLEPRQAHDRVAFRAAHHQLAVHQERRRLGRPARRRALGQSAGEIVDCRGVVARERDTLELVEVAPGDLHVAGRLAAGKREGREERGRGDVR